MKEASLNFFPFYTTLPAHSKTRIFLRAAKLDVCCPLSHHWITNFLAWVARERPDGHLGEIFPEDLAWDVRWPGDPDVYWSALVKGGWVVRSCDDVTCDKCNGDTQGWYVDNWGEYAGRAMAKRDARLAKGRERQQAWRDKQKKKKEALATAVDQGQNVTPNVTPNVTLRNAPKVKERKVEERQQQQQQEPPPVAAESEALRSDPAPSPPLLLLKEKSQPIRVHRETDKHGDAMRNALRNATVTRDITPMSQATDALRNASPDRNALRTLPSRGWQKPTECASLHPQLHAIAKQTGLDEFRLNGQSLEAPYRHGRYKSLDAFAVTCDRIAFFLRSPEADGLTNKAGYAIKRLREGSFAEPDGYVSPETRERAKAEAQRVDNAKIEAEAEARRRSQDADALRQKCLDWADRLDDDTVSNLAPGMSREGWGVVREALADFYAEACGWLGIASGAQNARELESSAYYGVDVTAVREYLAQEVLEKTG